MSEHENITNVITQKLDEIERKENVRILHAIESGSRAWGFASPDSDYDVRFVYVRRKDGYLKLEKTRDVIEWQLDDTLDINGWDLQKTLRLLHKSNPTLFEWISSPIVYRTTPQWREIGDLSRRFFQNKIGLYHYLSMAKGNYREYLKGETVKLKKYFYVLRPLLACQWILQTQTPPPVPFDELCAACLDPALSSTVNELLARKKVTSELGMGKRIDPLNEYLEKTIVSLDEALGSLPDGEPLAWQELNELFLSLL